MTIGSQAAGTNLTSAKPAQLHLKYLDGIRGLMALYVLLYHWEMIFGYRIGVQDNLFSNVLRWAFGYGHFAVGVFITLSGYVLMLPVVRSKDRQLRDGLPQFFMRRARRILPPYYAALFIFSGLIVLARLVRVPNDFNADLTNQTFLEHLFLYHNWTSSVLMIDPPMWSLAVEWQIYFVFALLLMPLYRRLGSLLTAVLALTLSVGLSVAFHDRTALSAPWYVGLFAIGMAAADLQFSNNRVADWAARVRWGWVSILSAVVVTVTFPFTHSGSTSALAVAITAALDTLIGISTLGMIMYCSRAALATTPEGRSNPVLRFWENRFLLSVGAFSYSLYLFHQPLVDYFTQAIRHVHLPLMVTWLATLLSLPFIVAICYVLYLMFEKPFIKVAPRTVVK